MAYISRTSVLKQHFEIMVKIVRIKNVRSKLISFFDQFPLLEPMHNQAQTSHSQPTHFVYRLEYD
ncbi:hypothetical protein BpHYR1_027691 [Brachionus plicatilis]|uniref:Uncharacterized protein n=1 Tax=Brachionus plicatilis TaxID=10195 RepID=A0A3M7Q6Z0_BRAPC|nr:hypothetical protein BpHYR1_027691 [Brachionus plicatilis]